ncbi:MAG: MBL fold metallo-hydrolase [Armatimonadota bacterium]|nr:MBL fold metallo-hydrolase [Armatimonadota bacterium]
MPVRLVILGTGGALETAERDNTALAFDLGDRAVLVDCPGSVYQKLLRAGITAARLAAVVMTHAHPDHIYGYPSLVHNLWMLDREAPVGRLPVYAPGEEIERLRRLLAIFDLDRRAAFLDYHPLPAAPGAPFFEHAGHRLFAHPVDHGPPAFALRWDTAGGRRVMHSTDTRPVEALAEFGRGADLFLHEATFAGAQADLAASGGHSTPAQAGRLATLAGAKRLLLLHLVDHAVPEQWVAEATTAFAGPVEIPDDGAVYAVE